VAIEPSELEALAGAARQYGYSDEEVTIFMQANPDPNVGAGAGVRTGASFINNPEDRLKYVQSKLGVDNVATTPKGDLIWRKPGEQSWKNFDEAGLSWKDVADFAGDVPELVTGAAGGWGGSVAGAAAGSAAGNVVKQIIGSVLGPSDSQETMGSRAWETAKSALFGGGGQAVGNVVSRGLASRSTKIAEDAAYKAEGDRLAQSVGGVDTPAGLTNAQRSGNRNDRIIEDQVRRNAFGGAVFENFELKKQVEPLMARLNRIMDDLVQGGVDDTHLGKVMKDTFERTAGKLREVVQMDAKRDARFLDELVGKTPSIPMPGLVAELRDLAKFGQPLQGFTGETAATAKWARKTLDDLEKSNGGVLTADQLQSWMHNATMSAQGQGRLADALHPSTDRYLASKLLSVLDADLERAATMQTKMVVPQGTNPENAAKLLRQFRDNYKTNSMAIDELANTVLAKRLGRDIPAESIGRNAEWLRSLNPQEIARSMEILEISKPGIRELAMRNLIEDSIRSAQLTANKQKDAYGRIPVAMDDLRLALPDNDTIAAILGNKHISAKDVSDVVGYLNRATARTLSTMSNQETWVKGMVKAVQNPSVGQLSMFAPRLAAEAMTDPAAWKWLRVLATNAGKGGAVARRAGEEFSRWALPRLGQEAALAIDAEGMPQNRSNLEQP